MAKAASNERLKIAPRPAPTPVMSTPRPSPALRLSCPTPEELALEAQQGSVAAYSELVRVFEGRLYNFLLRRVGSAADAEDLTQEAFLRAWQRLGTYRPKWRFSTWLFTIALRLAATHARREGRQPRPLLGDGLPGVGQASLPDDDGASRARIWALVDEVLSAHQRTALWLRYVEDMAVCDIARVMGRSQISVRVMLFRARAALAERLRHEPTVVEDLAPMVVLSRPVKAAQRGAWC